jgi:transposase
MAELRLTDEQWAFIKNFIPEQHMGRPRKREKECFEAILYVLKTGCQWGMLPSCYPPKSTVHDHFLWLKKERVFYRLFRKTRCNNPAQTVVHIDATLRLVKRGPVRQQGRQVQNHENNCPL